MVQYTFKLRIKGSYEEYKYTLSLNPQQEDNPEQIFDKEIRDRLRENLQRQSACEIKENHLNQIIKTWIEDISEGYRDSTITLDLRLLAATNLDKLQETGNHNLPALIIPDLLDVEPRFGMLPPLNFF